MKIIRLNPENIPAPVGKYSHVTIIPKNSDLYTFSGQIGVDNDGNIPENLNEQVQFESCCSLRIFGRNREVAPRVISSKHKAKER